MIFLRICILAACLFGSGFSFAQTASSWTTSDAARWMGSNTTFNSNATDCATVGTELIAWLTSGGYSWGWNGSCTGSATSGYVILAQNLTIGAGYRMTVTQVGVVAPPAAPSLVGASGSQYVIECVSNGGSSAVFPCTAIGSVGYSPVMYQAYVVDPANAPTPFDPAIGASFWALSLSTIVALYLVSKYVGEIVGFIKSVIN